MSGRIEADWMTLMGQAPATTNQYFFEAMGVIEGLCATEAYESVKPEQRIEFAIRLAQISSRDFHSAALSVLGDKISDAINHGSSEIGNAMLEQTSKS